MKFGERIKYLREARGWGQEELAKKAGLSRSSIASIEQRKSDRPSPYTLRKIAKAFGLSVADFFEEGGYGGKQKRRAETPEEILERLKLAQPMSIPVYPEFKVHAGEAAGMPVDYIYRARPKEAKREIEAYIVHGECMEPEIRDGDIVVIDRDLPPREGDTILCICKGELFVGHLKMKDGEPWLANNIEHCRLKECQASAVVIEAIKRLR